MLIDVTVGLGPGFGQMQVLRSARDSDFGEVDLPTA